MINGFIVSLNNQTIYRHNNSRIPGRLMRYLGEMDSDMQKGIQLGDSWEAAPTEFQKQQYVAITLFNGLQKNDKSLVNVMSAYLSDRFRTLTEIHITQKDDLFKLKIISK